MVSYGFASMVCFCVTCGHYARMQNCGKHMCFLLASYGLNFGWLAGMYYADQELMVVTEDLEVAATFSAGRKTIVRYSTLW